MSLIKFHPAERKVVSAQRAKKKYQTRYLPNLFDRLSNDFRFQDSETAESISHSQNDYKQSVLHDLKYLLNTLNSNNQFDIELYPEVSASTVNYGVPPIAGKFSSVMQVLHIENIIRNAILSYEPRIMPSSLFVAAVPTDPNKSFLNNVIPLRIGGQLWMEPYPLDFLVQTMLDVETNRIQLIA